MFKNPRIHPQFARTLILKLGLLFPHIKQLMNTNWRRNEENPHLMRRVDVYPLRGPHGRHHARTPMPRRRRPSGRRAERHAAPSQRRDRAVGRRGPPCLDVAIQQAAGPPGCSSPPRLDTTRAAMLDGRARGLSPAPAPPASTAAASVWTGVAGVLVAAVDLEMEPAGSGIRCGGEGETT